ncbi:MAG: probable secreted protein, partial [uncultured Quadrisphaera sp.]
MSEERGPWRRYVALGDSFTEGLSDPVGGDDDPAAVAAGPFRGWADRLAELLDDAQRAAGAPPLEYANLAVRGRLQRQILGEQLPAALALEPDLVSLSAGGNDLLRPSTDARAVAARTEEAVAALRAAGCDVLLVTGADPQAAPVLRLTRARVADHNQRLWALAQRHGARVVDLWGLEPLQDPRMWAADRLHLSSEGHRRVARLAAATLLGTDADDREWERPLPPARRSRAAAAREDAAWARTHLAPWVRRRLQ